VLPARRGRCAAGGKRAMGEGAHCAARGSHATRGESTGGEGGSERRRQPAGNARARRGLDDHEGALLDNRRAFRPAGGMMCCKSCVALSPARPQHATVRLALARLEAEASGNADAACALVARAKAEAEAGARARARGASGPRPWPWRGPASAAVPARRPSGSTRGGGQRSRRSGRRKRAVGRVPRRQGQGLA